MEGDVSMLPKVGAMHLNREAEGHKLGNAGSF